MYNNQPKYEAGEIIDLRFTRDSMPDRIYVEMVYRKPKSTEWMYRIVSEKSGGIFSYVSESEIDKRVSHKDKKCYEHEIVKQLYSNGFRFCGNSKFETAFNRANNMKCARYIRHIILAEAIDPDGNPIDGELGMWVQYNIVFDDTMAENIPQKNEDGYYHIK